MISLRIWACIVPCLCLWLRAEAGKIAGVCTDVTPLLGQPEKPPIPDTFEVHVECNLLDRNHTVYVTEWYDQALNYGRVHQKEFLQEGDLYYDYDHNELVTVDRFTGQCEVETLSSSTNRFLFGVTSTASGQKRIFAPSGALHFGTAPELYVGTDVVRGILVDKWTSCQYSDVMDATMNVTWYFTANNTWDTQLGFQGTPIRAHVIGKRNDAGGGSHAFDHIYDFFDFERALDTQVFQLRSGDYCPGRYTQKPFPKLPGVFSMIGERLDNENNVVSVVEEHYDNIRKVNVYRYKDSTELGLLTGQNDRIEINDFNEGIAYIINEKLPSCQIRKVSEGRFAYVDFGSGTAVRQQTPAEFLLANKVTFEYQGQKTIRGMRCDAWIGMSNHTQAYPGRHVIIEWYFLTADYQDWNQMPTGTRVPAAIYLWKHQDDDVPMYTFSTFGFSLDRPMIVSLDISPCFHGADRVEVHLDFNATYKDAITSDVETFKAKFMSDLSLFVGISPLRISDLKLYFGQTVIEVVFDLVDKPPFVGDVANPEPQNSLRNALDLLMSSTVENDIQISYLSGDNVVTMPPLKNSLRINFSNGTCFGNCNAASGSSPGSGSNSDNTGAFAGLGVGMLVLGGILGSAVGFRVLGFGRYSWDLS